MKHETEVWVVDNEKRRSNIIIIQISGGEDRDSGKGTLYEDKKREIIIKILKNC